MFESGQVLSQIKNIHLAFTMDCNLRCSYCISHSGTLGYLPQVMSEQSRQQFLHLLNFSDHATTIEFGTGETFLYYNEFLRFIDQIQSLRIKKGIRDEISVATNGTLIDHQKIDDLLARGVCLVFSLDGDNSKHRLQRTNGNGKTFHDRALDNLLYYKKQIDEKGQKQKNIVRSVVTHKNSLRDVEEFWQKMGFSLFSSTVAFPNDFNNENLVDQFWVTQKKYLQDLSDISIEKATALSNPAFLSEYTGPIEILDGWSDLLLDRRKSGCGIFETIIAVNAYGEIYPCDQVMANKKWCIGSLESGLHQETFDTMKRDMHTCDIACVGCKVENDCPSVCLAERYLVLMAGNSVSSNCDFMIHVQDIINSSYEKL